MKLFRRGGTHRAMLSSKAKVASIATVAALALSALLFGVTQSFAAPAPPHPGRVPAQAAALSLSPSVGALRIGHPLVLTLRTTITGTDTRTSEADLTFPADKFNCGQITINPAAWPVVAEKTCTPGLVKIAVGTYNGPKTGRFDVATVALIPKATGPATIRFAPSSMVISDATQTNILNSTNVGHYTIRR